MSVMSGFSEASAGAADFNDHSVIDEEEEFGHDMVRVTCIGLHNYPTEILINTRAQSTKEGSFRFH